MSSEGHYQEEPPRPVVAEGSSPPGGVSADEKQWGLFAHLSALASSLVTGVGLLGPLVVWLIKKEESPFVDDQGKEALNFQINLLIHVIVLVVISLATCGFGALLFIPWVPYALAMPIIGGVRAHKGERYRYPLTWRIIK